MTPLDAFLDGVRALIAAVEALLASLPEEDREAARSRVEAHAVRQWILGAATAYAPKPLGFIAPRNVL